MNYMRVELFVPKLPYHPSEAMFQEIVQEVGGCTRISGVGSWQGDAEVITEGVDIFLFFCEDTEDNRLWLETITREYKEDAAQECVLYVINCNTPHFIED